MARLRAPGGCPWDREQTFESIQKYTLEETYEVFDAIERRDWQHLKEELGDLLLQVLFFSEMAAEAGHFTIADAIETLNLKLVRRHPHVFGEEASAAAGNVATLPGGMEGIDAPQVLRNWEQIKAAEKASRAESETSKQLSRLVSVPRALPSLMEAAQLGLKAAKSGFDWPDSSGIFAKLDEEIQELKGAIGEEKAHQDGKTKEAVASELGDLLFTVVNLSRHLGVDPEFALRRTNAKFRRRFAAMERNSERPLEELSADQLEEIWSAAKLDERTAKIEP